ncbi:MAG: oligosaccharide flippase family protein [Lentimicrobiaceae bacterium]|nr:oligosaccharide flippase family protein [Lentimicrobiaceae bacterium]
MGVVVRQSIKGSIVNYVGAFIGFLTSFYILTKYLTQEEIGLTRVLIESAMLVAALAQLGTTNSIVRFFPYFKNKELKHHGFLGFSVLIPFVGAVFFCTLYVLLRQPIIHFFSENSALFLNYFYYVIPLAVFFVYIGVFETYSSVLQRVVVPRFIREVGIRVMAVGVYLLWAFRVVTFDQFIILFVLIYGVAAILNLLYVFALKEYSFKPNFRFARKPLRRNFYYYTAFLFAAAIGGTITAKIDTFMVSSMLGLAQTGVFTIAYFMAAIIDIPFRSLNMISMPIVSGHLKNKAYGKVQDLYKKVSLNQLIAGGLLFVLIWINIDTIFAILPNGKDYVAGKYVVLFIALSRLVDSGFNFGLSILSLSKYYYYYLFFIFFLSALGICTNWIFIPLYGISGAALATLISFVIYNALVMLIVYIKMKITPFSLPQLKLLLLVLGLLGINYFIPYKFDNQIVDGVIRSLITLGIGGFAVLKLKLSEDVDRLWSMLWGKMQ